jgi:NifU-like protein involved in Fe-S cluster formation
MIITPELEPHFQDQQHFIPQETNLLERNWHYRIATNSICKDVVAVFAFVNAFGRITHTKFKHSGCVISKISANVACSILNGETLQSARDTAEEFIRALETGTTNVFGGKRRILNDLVAMMCTRQTCVALPWVAIKEFGK